MENVKDNPSKDQLMKCIMDLSVRANELQLRELECILLTLTGVMIENRETEFAIWCGEYAKMRIAQDGGDLEDEESEE